MYYESQIPLLHDEKYPWNLPYLSDGQQHYYFDHLHVESKENGGKDTFSNQDSLYFLAPIYT